jgi:predicted RNase H-like HicB family nuclease
MLTRYIHEALQRAHYEMIEDEEPYYGEVKGLNGVWATGKTLEECRQNLEDAIEDWGFFSLANSSSQPLRPFGLCAGEFVVPDDFDASLPVNISGEFECL